jgi:hypothetical protein
MTFKPLMLLILNSIFFISCSTVVIPKKATRDILKKKPRIVYKQRAKCESQIKYFKLLSKLSDKKNGFSYLAENSTDDLCDLYYKKTAKFFENHSGKVGIIFEANSDNSDMDRAILSGILRSSKINKKSKGYIVKRVILKNQNIQNALSSLILKKKVGVIITWGNTKFLKKIEKWQKRLSMPTLYIDNKIKKSKTAFKIFPNRNNYSIELVKSLRKKKIKRLAILTPKAYQKSKLLLNIKKNLKKYGIEIVHDVIYEAGDYHTMEMACRKIFNININGRREEFNQILKKEKKQANAEGFKLNRKHVFLTAQTDFDAIFIPDNFKIVNHFAKLFDYFKAPRIPLVGTYEWRSPELTKTKNKYLEGAIFVDFIGNPKDLPIWSKTNEGQNKKVGLKADYKLMGYYSGLLGQKVLRKSNKRKRVENDLRSMKIKDNFIKNNKAFKNNEFNWPSYAFEVRDNRFKPLSHNKSQHGGTINE